MYHSNQVLDITCEAKDLARVIGFAAGIYADASQMFTRQDGRVKMAFAEPLPHVYALGTGSMAPYAAGPSAGHGPGKGWTDFPFDYDPGIIARIAAQWLDSNPPDRLARPDIDGFVSPGLRAMSLRSAVSAGILPPLYELEGWDWHGAVLVLAPCWLEYHK